MIVISAPSQSLSEYLFRNCKSNWLNIQELNFGKEIALQEILFRAYWLSGLTRKNYYSKDFKI